LTEVIMGKSDIIMKRIVKTAILIILVFISVLRIGFSQQEITKNVKSLSLSEYLSGVVTGNLGYIAGQFNVSIAEAMLKAAKVFPDPEISILYTNNEDRTLQMGQSVEVGFSYPINLGNKRGAGIALAKSQYELTRFMLDAYFQNLRADAALSYFACLKDQKIYMLQEDIYRQLIALARADSIRLKTGEATVLDAMQSSLEARSQKLKVIQSYTSFQNSLVTLSVLQGKKNQDTLGIPSDTFPLKKRDFQLDKLINNAIEKRAELLVALKNMEVNEKSLNLLKANRAFEFSLETGYSYNSIVKNEIAPAPAYNALSAGISFPLKLSNINRGEILAAENAIKQSQVYYEEAKLQITSEVIMAYNTYLASYGEIEHYNLGLIEDAGKILKGRIFSYQRGESGLTDVLNAQRSYIELQLNYIEALFNYTKALIELERAAGIWDISG